MHFSLKHSTSAPMQEQSVCDVGVVDGHFLSREGLRAFIGGLDRYRCVWCANTAMQAEEGVNLHVPDILLVDVNLPDSNGLELVRHLHAQHPDLRILVASTYDEMFYAERVLRAGAKGYLKKDSEAASFEAALRTVRSGKVFVSAAVSECLVSAYYEGNRPGAESGLHLLSDRELEVLQLLGNGFDTARISSFLGISPKTVDVHRGKIKRKLDFKYAADVVRMAMRWVETGGLGRSPELMQR